MLVNSRDCQSSGRWTCYCDDDDCEASETVEALSRVGAADELELFGWKRDLGGEWYCPKHAFTRNPKEDE